MREQYIGVWRSAGGHVLRRLRIDERGSRAVEMAVMTLPMGVYPPFVGRQMHTILYHEVEYGYWFPDQIEPRILDDRDWRNLVHMEYKDGKLVNRLVSWADEHRVCQEHIDKWVNPDMETATHHAPWLNRLTELVHIENLRGLVEIELLERWVVANMWQRYFDIAGHAIRKEWLEQPDLR